MSCPVRSLPVFILLAVLLSGCIPYRQIGPDAFPSDGNFSLQNGPVAWWQIFDDPALDRLMERLFENNLDLMAAKSRIVQAEIARQKAGAPLSPSLDFGADAKHYVGSFENYNTVSASFRAGYEIDLWGRLDDLSEAAIYDERQRSFDYQAMAVTLSATLVNEWYGFVYTVNYSTFLKRKIALAKKGVELLRRRYFARQAKLSDLLLQESVLKQMESELTTLRYLEHGHRNAIAALLGEDGGKLSMERSAVLPYIETGRTPVVDSKCILKRPDIAAAIASLKALDRRAAAAVSAQYPRFSLAASAGQDNILFNNLFELWYSSITASLAAPLFDGESRAADARMALEKRKEQLLRLKKLLIDASVETSNALKALETGRINYLNLVEQLRIDEKKAACYRSGYLHGTEDFKRYLDAETALISTRQKVLRAKLDLITYSVALYRSTASGWRPVRSIVPAGRKE
ncbi:RND efflux system, outer membrane lipoprotein, NodT family [Hydrogenimonas sp.]|nr:RND efflux system, outer membrane lipoprotein, NodT family [Hydrogenimonas sp.]